MLEQVTKLPLNPGQTLASEGFFEFLLGPDKEINISGPGGVGKTFLMGHLIDEIMPMYHDTCKLMGIPPLYNSVQMTATTNKAAEVLGQQTGRPTSTVHSFFGLKVMDDYSTGESKVTKSNTWTVYNNLILFIDEASMIDKQLYDLIQEGTCNCKVVYVGDENQLAPVKEVLSPVYKRAGIPMFELLEPMRTSIPELQALNTQCRSAVQSGKNTGIHQFEPIKVIPGVIDWLDGPEFEAEIALNFQQQTSNSVILAYTNNRVIEYNTHIRGMRGLPKEFQAGEVLISNSAVRFGKHALAVEDEVTIVKVEEDTDSQFIGEGAMLDVRHALVENSFGDQIRVSLPVDREHYAELIKYYRKVKNWTAYYKLRNNFPDLRQRDARTVYKIQGSSVDTVYIDVGNLSTCHNPAQAARLIYVAVSRARQRVAFFGDLADKYGGLVL